MPRTESWGVPIPRDQEYEEEPYKAKDVEKVHAYSQEGEAGEVLNWGLRGETASKRKA